MNPTSHVSNVTLDSAILLSSIVNRMKIDATRMIYNQVLESTKPSKGLWFLALITKICTKGEVTTGQEEERLKPSMPIITKMLEEPQVFKGQKQQLLPKAHHKSLLV